MFPSIDLSLGRPGCRWGDARSRLSTRLRRVLRCNFRSAAASVPPSTQSAREDTAPAYSDGKLAARRAAGGSVGRSGRGGDTRLELIVLNTSALCGFMTLPVHGQRNIVLSESASSTPAGAT